MKSSNFTPMEVTLNDYRWLLRRVEAGKWPILFHGAWHTEEQVMDVLCQYEMERDVLSEPAPLTPPE